MPYFVYMLTNRRQTSLFTGITGDLEKRVRQHKFHAVEDGTKRCDADRLVYFEEFAGIGDALAREQQIKSWTRARKNALVASINPAWDDLSVGWCPGGEHGSPGSRRPFGAPPAPDDPGGKQEMP